MKNNEIIIKEINNYGNGFAIKFECGKDAQMFFSNNNFFCNYNIDISKIKDDILLIPFISNILPILWMFDIELTVEKLDKAFYNSIENIMQGYKKMFPMFTFSNHRLQVKKLIENKYTPKKELVLFSGGADAYQTLIDVYSDKIELFSVIGADIPYDNEQSIAEFKNTISFTADLFNTKANYCTTNFKKFLNYSYIEQLTKECNDNYWHAFQHGIGLISLTSPILKNIAVGTIYIASSYSLNEEKRLKHITCASHYTIDNNFCALNATTHHHGIQYDRIDKIANLCNYAKNNNISLPLHVCWENITGINCCHCEKCYRTIITICALGIIEPNRLGFNLDNRFFKRFKQFIKYKGDKLSPQLIIFMQLIQSILSETSLYYHELVWFKKYNFNNYNKSILRNIRYFYRRCRSFSGRIIRSILGKRKQ